MYEKNTALIARQPRSSGVALPLKGARGGTAMSASARSCGLMQGTNIEGTFWGSKNGLSRVLPSNSLQNKAGIVSPLSDGSLITGFLKSLPLITVHLKVAPMQLPMEHSSINAEASLL